MNQVNTAYELTTKIFGWSDPSDTTARFDERNRLFAVDLVRTGKNKVSRFSSIQEENKCWLVHPINFIFKLKCEIEEDEESPEGDDKQAAEERDQRTHEEHVPVALTGTCRI